MNEATRTNVATLGTILGISGIFHGFFEGLQGPVPTSGFIISAIGDAQKMWPHGNEPAFTLIPNYLITGIAAMVVGFAAVVWSLGFVHKKFGPTIFLLLFILLLLVGGGIAQIIFFPFIWLVSTRINKPLIWWRKILPVKIHIPLGKPWLWCLIAGSALFVFALEIAITGFVPAVYDTEIVLTIMVSCLVTVLLLLPITFVSGFSHDISKMPDTDRESKN